MHFLVHLLRNVVHVRCDKADILMMNNDKSYQEFILDNFMGNFVHNWEHRVLLAAQYMQHPFSCASAKEPILQEFVHLLKVQMKKRAEEEAQVNDQNKASIICSGFLKGVEEHVQ